MGKFQKPDLEKERCCPLLTRGLPTTRQVVIRKPIQLHVGAGDLDSLCLSGIGGKPYSRGMSKPNGFKLETKQVERVPAFGPSTRRTMARADESNSAPTFSTITL